MASRTMLLRAPVPLLLILLLSSSAAVSLSLPTLAAVGFGEAKLDGGDSEVDSCDSCAASGYALHDALEYQQARRRARFGSDITLATLEPTEVASAVAAAVEAACGARGRWMRFQYKHVGGGGIGIRDPQVLLTLSGPGLDAHFVPGVERHDDDDARSALTATLRQRCVEDANRVGVPALAHAFNVSSHVLGAAPADGDTEEHGAQPRAEAAAAFASMICVKGELLTGATKRSKEAMKKIAGSAPCTLAATKRKARQLLDAAESARTEQATLTGRADVDALTHQCTMHNATEASGHALEHLDSDVELRKHRENIESVRLCQTLARAALDRGEALERFAAAPPDASAPAAAVHLSAALRSYATAESVSEQHAGEATLRAARLLATSGSDELTAVESAAAALAAAARSVAADPHEPDGRLTLGDLLVQRGDPTGALAEYRAALYFLPLFGTVPAAVTSSRGSAAASLAHQFAHHLSAMEEGIAAFDDSTGATKRDEVRAVANEARVNGAARAKEAAEDHLEALVMQPTRRRHVSMAASMLVHASLADTAGGLEQWRSAVAAAEVVDKCDEARPPRECYHVLLGHARSLFDLELWGLAREAAHLAVSALGEKTSKASGGLGA